MPFRTLQDKDFIGRQQELTTLYKKVCEADTGTAQSLVLSGARGIGKTELLKQLFGLLFWKQDRIAPFYFTGNPAVLSASTFSKNYLVRFLCQRLAFENKDQALFSCEGISLSALSALAEDRDAGWAKELIDQYQRNADDPVSALRIAFGAPHQSALMSGTPVAVLIDEFHRLKGLSLEGFVDPQLISLMEGPMACAKTSHVITGNSAELQEMSVASCLENIVLAPLEGADAASRAMMLLHANEIEGQVPPLLLRRLGGNPFYLSCVCKTVSEKKKPEAKDFWNAYTKEILQGTLARFWSTVLKGSFPDLSVRSIALAVSHKIYRTKEPLSCRRIASLFALTDSQAEMIAHVLYRAGIIRGEFGVFRPLEDNVLRDIIDCLYRKEILAASSHDLERECMEKLLPEKAEAVRFDLVLPMTKDAELVAAQCLEQVGKNLRLNQDTIGQLQIAIIEACINAMEHSRGTERKIYVGLAADEQRLEVSIESSGQEFIVKETGEPFGDQEATRPPGRGWGIKLMKRFADDVRFEKTSRGIKTVLIKNLDSSMRVQKEATNNE